MELMWPKLRKSKASPTTRVTAVGVALACVVALTPTLMAHADDVQDQKRDAERRIASLGQQLEGTNEKLATAYLNLEKTKAALPIAQRQLQDAQTQVGRAEAAQTEAEDTERRALGEEAKARAHNDEVAQKLAVAQANEARAKEQLTKSEKQLSSSQDALDAYAAEVFQGGGTESQLGLVFGADSPQDFADRMVMADTASAVASDTVDHLATLRAENVATRSYLSSVRGEIAELKRKAEIALQHAEAAAAAATQAKQQAIVARQNAETARDNATAAKTELDGLQAKQTTYANELKSVKANQQHDLQEARQEAARLNAILVERARQARIKEQQRRAKLEAERQAKIKAEQQKAAEAAKKGQKYTPKPPPPPPPAAGQGAPGFALSYPARGPMTSGFGMRWHPVLQKWMLHDGLDWGIACGTPVYAAADGEVIRAGWRPSGWGNQVVIDHGMHRGIDLVTTYNHLSSISKWGGHVRRGQLVGYSGTTGYSTGCHLHFGVYEDGTPVNPQNWL
jgi:murein DD-endopeptidase MepM/ murein hydrolase activator NlpD